MVRTLSLPIPYCRFYRELVPRDIRNPQKSENVINRNSKRKPESTTSVQEAQISEQEVASMIKTAQILFKSQKIKKGFDVLNHAIQG